jgi:hypothetical protein
MKKEWKVDNIYQPLGHADQKHSGHVWQPALLIVGVLHSGHVVKSIDLIKYHY